MGRPTQIIALLPGSAVIDVGGFDVCVGTPVNNCDQRAIIRSINAKNMTQGLLLKVQSGNVPNSGAISVVYDAKAKELRVSALRLERNGKISIWTVAASNAVIDDFGGGNAAP